MYKLHVNAWPIIFKYRMSLKYMYVWPVLVLRGDRVLSYRVFFRSHVCEICQNIKAEKIKY